MQYNAMKENLINIKYLLYDFVIVTNRIHATLIISLPYYIFSTVNP